MKIKIDPNDTLYSKIIRLERPVCEACRSSSSTQVHHFFGRRYKNTRFDDNNIIAVCFACHRKFHEDHEFGSYFIIQKLGEEQYRKLVLKKNIYCRLDKKALNIYLKQRFKALAEI